jgi:uncharacterized protein (TIGR00369 family)
MSGRKATRLLCKHYRLGSNLRLPHCRIPYYQITQTAMETEFDLARLAPLITATAHNRLLAIQYCRHGEDWVELELPYSESLVGDPATRILASGPIFSLMDIACSMAIWLTSRCFRPMATVDMRVDYLRPARPGKSVIGRGQCYRLTKNIAFVRGEGHDGDFAKPLAHVAGTFMFTDVE